MKKRTPERPPREPAEGKPGEDDVYAPGGQKAENVKQHSGAGTGIPDPLLSLPPRVNVTPRATRPKKPAKARS